MDSINLEIIILLLSLVAFYKKTEASYFLIGSLILRELHLPFELVQDVGVLLLLGNVFLHNRNHKITTILITLVGLGICYIFDLKVTLEVLEGLLVLISGYLLVTIGFKEVITALFLIIGGFLYLKLSSTIGLILIILVLLVKNLKYLRVGVPHRSKSKKRSGKLPQKNN